MSILERVSGRDKTRTFLLVFILSITSQSYARETIVVSNGGLEKSIFQQMAQRTLTRAYSRLGLDIEYVKVPNQRALTNANTANSDGVLARIAGLEKDFSNLIRIPISVGYDEILVYSKEFNFKVDSWKSLAPYKIGFVSGFKKVEYRTKDMDVEKVTSPTQGLQKLNLGRTDVFIGVIGIKCLAEKLKLPEITAIDKPLERITLYHYLHKRHTKMVDKLIKVLKEMEDSGEIASIQKQAKQEFIVQCQTD